MEGSDQREREGVAAGHCGPSDSRSLEARTVNTATSPSLMRPEPTALSGGKEGMRLTLDEILLNVSEAAGPLTDGRLVPIVTATGLPLSRTSC